MDNKITLLKTLMNEINTDGIIATVDVADSGSVIKNIYINECILDGCKMTCYGMSYAYMDGVVYNVDISMIAKVAFDEIKHQYILTQGAKVITFCLSA